MKEVLWDVIAPPHLTGSACLQMHEGRQNITVGAAGRSELGDNGRFCEQLLHAFLVSGLVVSGVQGRESLEDSLHSGWVLRVTQFFSSGIDIIEEMRLSGHEDARMLAKNLGRERRPRSRSSHDEYWCIHWFKSSTLCFF
jgi:hypothetical protein